MEELFPGIVEELLREGTTRTDFAADVCWFHHGHWKLRYPSHLSTLFQSRPFLEGHVRQRLASCDNVTVRYETAVLNLLATADRSRITGVQIQAASGAGAPEDVAADLVIDASGPGSRLPHWLAALQYPQPAESTVKIRLSYASRLYRPPAGGCDWLAMLLYPKAPESTRAGYIFPVEGQRWTVTMAGYMGDAPPHEEAGFPEYARGLSQPDIYQALQGAQPLSDIKTYHVPEEVRRHYERLRRVPDGVLAMGDAVCRFDPIFGQGMIVAAKEARLLGQLLHTETQQGNDVLVGLPRRFYQAIAPVIDVPWILATSEGYRYPQAEGQRPFGTALRQWYVAQIFALSATHPEVYGPFMQVLHLLKEPASLFAPAVLGRVLKHSVRGAGRRLVTSGRPRWPGNGA